MKRTPPFRQKIFLIKGIPLDISHPSKFFTLTLKKHLLGCSPLTIIRRGYFGSCMPPLKRWESDWTSNPTYHVSY